MKEPFANKVYIGAVKEMITKNGLQTFLPFPDEYLAEIFTELVGTKRTYDNRLSERTAKAIILWDLFRGKSRTMRNYSEIFGWNLRIVHEFLTGFLSSLQSDIADLSGSVATLDREAHKQETGVSADSEGVSKHLKTAKKQNSGFSGGITGNGKQDLSDVPPSPFPPSPSSPPNTPLITPSPLPPSGEKEINIINAQAPARDLEVSSKEETRKPVNENPPTIEEIISYGATVGVLEIDCREFYEHYEIQNWIRGNGLAIWKWQPLLTQWKVQAAQRKYRLANETKTKKPRVQNGSEAISRNVELLKRELGAT